MANGYGNKYAVKPAGGGRFVTVNLRTGTVMTKPVIQREAQQIADRLNLAKLGEANLDNVLEGAIDKELADMKVPKIYVSNGSTMSSFESIVDEPSQLYEDGLGGAISAPQALAVGSTAGLALENGVHQIMLELREHDFDVNPETGEEWLPGVNPFDRLIWVGDDDKPYDESAPLTMRFWGEAWHSEPGEERWFEPYGRPFYRVWLIDPKDENKPAARTNPDLGDDCYACVIVQEMELDK